MSRIIYIKLGRWRRCEAWVGAKGRKRMSVKADQRVEKSVEGNILGMTATISCNSSWCSATRQTGFGVGGRNGTNEWPIWKMSAFGLGGKGRPARRDNTRADRVYGAGIHFRCVSRYAISRNNRDNLQLGKMRTTVEVTQDTFAMVSQ